MDVEVKYLVTSLWYSMASCQENSETLENNTKRENSGFTSTRKYRRAASPDACFYGTTGFREFPLGMPTRTNGIRCFDVGCLDKWKRHGRSIFAAPTIMCPCLSLLNALRLSIAYSSVNVNF